MSNTAPKTWKIIKETTGWIQ